MTNYHATLGRFQLSKASLLILGLDWLSDLWQDAKHRLIERHTRNVLTALDRRTLEDIGVPHEDASPRAGVLNRYHEIIRPRR